MKENVRLLAHFEKYFPIKENGTSVWAFVLHVIETLLSVMRSHELYSKLYML